MELVRENGWPVTFSIGVATFLNPPYKTDEMIDAADAQMYFAKQKGKNRIQHKIVAENNNASNLKENRLSGLSRSFWRR